jgi:hypothetical protein
VRSDDVFGRTVDEIPVVDSTAVAKVRAINRGAALHVAALILPDQNQEGEQPFFMPRGFEQTRDVL